MSTVFAVGKTAYCLGSLLSGSNLNLKVPSRPVVVVAAYVTFSFSSRGIRNVEVHPAPRMRMSTLAGRVSLTSV